MGTASRLINCLAIDMVVAWRIHHLTWLGRETPELSCTVAFDDDQWKAVILFTTRKPAPATPPSLNEMIRMTRAKLGQDTSRARSGHEQSSVRIARLGGRLGRKSDGDPGSETLWKGLQRMDDIVWTAKICMEAYDLRQPE